MTANVSNQVTDEALALIRRMCWGGAVEVGQATDAWRALEAHLGSLEEQLRTAQHEASHAEYWKTDREVWIRAHNELKEQLEALGPSAARKVEAYDAARARVKREGFSRAEYVLRAEHAEEQLQAAEKALETPRQYDVLLSDMKEQLETFLDAAWKFEQEMANGEFVHFGEFRRALVAASGTDRGSNPASRPPENVSYYVEADESGEQGRTVFRKTAPSASGEGTNAAGVVPGSAAHEGAVSNQESSHD